MVWAKPKGAFVKRITGVVARVKAKSTLFAGRPAKESLAKNGNVL
jgi:hypothetical protein